MAAKKFIIELATEAGIIIGKDLIVHDERFYERVFRDESLGLGESYMLRWWDVGADTSLDELVYKICNADLRQKLSKATVGHKLKLGATYLYNYLFPVKSIEDSKVVAVQHYDLDRSIYESMLDPMVYSCAYFKTDDDTLRQAQINKMELIEKKIGLKSGMRILDVGCGWGQLAAYLGRNNDIEVDAITISVEQYNYAKDHFGTDKIKFYLKDYREFKTAKPYDAIVSVGMFEHVNSYNYEEFMRIQEQMLKDGGLFLLHTIGSIKTGIVPDKWICRYIFPNSCLPSMAQIAQSSEKYFVIEDLQNFGTDYDKTLRLWHENFTKNFDEVNAILSKPLSPEFYRMWVYYLLSCAGAFRARRIQLYQVVLSKKYLGKYTRNI